MFREAWRIQREMFYDPGLHGVNLSDVMGKYERFVPRLSSRSDLTYLFQEMMGELTVGHLGAGGGEQPEVRTVQTGLLGADYEVAGNRYRFRRIYNGENWNPTLRAPLTEPGVNVTAGEYLLAVDGRDVSATDNVYRFFEARAGKQVRTARRTKRQWRRRARRRRGAGAIRVGPAHARMGGGQPPEGEPDDRWPRGLYLHARHVLWRIHELQPVLLRAGEQERGHHRRAIQRRRHAGHRHCRDARRASR